MYFNSPRTYATYADYFHGMVRRWVNVADQQGLYQDADLEQFLGQELAAYFPQVRRILARAYPGESDDTYRLLMDMNLAHGYYMYASAPLVARSDYETLHLGTGNCVEISDLLSILLRSQGYKAFQVVQSYNYLTPLGRFVSSHDVVYANGLWLDAEINTAFAIPLSELRNLPPANRLEDLVSGHHVFGFYDYYLEPHVRLTQLRYGEDGGIIAFYYQYYFQGIGLGHSSIDLVPQD
jgi:hypothetical protein